MRKKILFAVMALLTMATGNIWAQDVPYVVFNNGTLYFMCRESADLTEIIVDGETVKLDTDDGSSTKNCWRGTEVTDTGESYPGWCSNNITNVVIDESFKKANITSCKGWFATCYNLETLDLSNLNTSNVTNMCAMFENCSSLTSLDLSSFNTSNVTDMSDMFYQCHSLTSLDLSNFNTSNVTDMFRMFCNCWSLTSLDLSSFDTSNVTNMSAMLGTCTHLTSLNLSNFNTSNVTDMCSMFSDCCSLTSLDLSSFDTSNVTNMAYMFRDCRSLTSLDLSNFKTSNVTNMAYMFNSCLWLTSLDLSSFDTSDVTDMRVMFGECTSLISLNLSSFNTSNVTDMSDMFENCSSLTSLDLSNFNTSNVTNMRVMFYQCHSLTSLDLSNFDTSNVTNMEDMFWGCRDLTSLNLSSFNTSNVTGMFRMFSDCSSLTSLDLSNFNTSIVADMRSLFNGCNRLTSLNLKNFNTSNVSSEYMQGIFDNCPSLRLVNLSKATIPNFSEFGVDIDDHALTYVPVGTTVTEGKTNVVVGKDCEHFVIGDNQLLLSLPYGFTAKKITVDRNFTVEKPHTLCLPFAVDAKAYGTFYAYKEYDENGKGVTFNALDGTEATTANRPYLFMPAETLENGIVIDTPTEIAAYTAETSADGEFIGIYKEKTFTGEEAGEGVYYAWADGEFERVVEGASVDACCACLRLPASSANSAPARLSVDLGGSAAGICTAESGADGDRNAPVYNLQGQRVGSSYKGVMIRNGKKMIVK